MSQQGIGHLSRPWTATGERDVPKIGQLDPDAVERNVRGQAVDDVTDEVMDSTDRGRCLE